MLISNLSVLLAQRRLTISRVSADTRLSRTTLTALAGGSAKGIQFDTLNTLCQYLKVAPGDLFTYRPFDLSVDCPGTPGRSCVAFVVRRAGRRDERLSLDCDARFIPSPGATPPVIEALRVRLMPPEGDGPEALRARELVDLLKALPAPALASLELDILRAYDRGVDPALAPDDYSPELLWPWQ